MLGKLVLIIGPSGVGKSVILKSLRKQYPDLHFPRSATTRERREGEGDDLYDFVSDEEFDALINEGKVLEWATVHEGARYGTLIEEITPFIDHGKTVVREVDVQGFRSIRKHPLFSGTTPRYIMESVFILPENREQLVDRIKGRAPISEEELSRRVKSMDDELSEAESCDYQIVNRDGDLEGTVEKVAKALPLQ